MESFVNNAFKRPFKLFMLCMVLYMASQSFVVGTFVSIVGISYLWHRFTGRSNVVPAAPKVSMPEQSVKSKPQAEHQQAEPPEQSYERSAVVTPFRRTGTHDRS